MPNVKRSVDGYKNCLNCQKEFPYRKTLKSRGTNYGGVKIGSINQKFCSHRCSLIFKNRTEKSREISRQNGLKNKGKTHKENEETRKNKSELWKGEKSHFWRGGISPINKTIRSSVEYSLWREAVFTRDNFTCVWCKKRGGKLNADHIKPFAFFPELRFAIDNGRTLCEPCHKTTDTWAGRAKNCAIKEHLL